MVNKNGFTQAPSTKTSKADCIDSVSNTEMETTMACPSFLHIVYLADLDVLLVLTIDFIEIFV